MEKHFRQIKGKSKAPEMVAGLGTIRNKTGPAWLEGYEGRGE